MAKSKSTAKTIPQKRAASPAPSLTFSATSFEGIEDVSTDAAIDADINASEVAAAAPAADAPTSSPPAAAGPATAPSSTANATGPGNASTATPPALQTAAVITSPTNNSGLFLCHASQGASPAVGGIPIPTDVAQISHLMQTVRASPLHSTNMGARSLTFEKAGKGPGYGFGMVMEDGEAAQFVLGLKLLQSFLVHLPTSQYATWSITCTGSGVNVADHLPGLEALQGGVEGIDNGARPIHPKSTHGDIFFKADVPKGEIEAAKTAGENLTFPNVYDARGRTSLNGSPLLTNRALLQNGPDVAVVFSAKVWKGDGITPFNGGRAHRGGNPEGWSVSYGLISLFLIGNSAGGGASEAVVTPKKHKAI
ncbi:uncharacterized protein MKK02DRAFT_40516 [Dioszegia hungarica]|uniref:Uncharacterized protein n=1 Tax=Dioszegia hungarica TaxID=4972 RepID=A0AA38H442_9TREE|nr:uncharacterized protein MKK02DRAFT_40516 [Dioszegia hungarica]KAI9632216.1 hypothetical protein MKK02DRAFT_40516 [Dioszegia hungarica]